MATKKSGEKIHRLGLADPRSGKERLAAAVNRVTSGNRKSPVRKFDDSPEELRRKIAASKKPVATKKKK